MGNTVNWDEPGNILEDIKSAKRMIRNATGLRPTPLYLISKAEYDILVANYGEDCIKNDFTYLHHDTVTRLI